jgi:hypothetical protein
MRIPTGRPTEATNLTTIPTRIFSDPVQPPCSPTRDRWPLATLHDLSLPRAMRCAVRGGRGWGKGEGIRRYRSDGASLSA